jgi:hypothetical protein
MSKAIGIACSFCGNFATFAVDDYDSTATKEWKTVSNNAIKSLKNDHWVVFRDVVDEKIKVVCPRCVVAKQLAGD